MKYEEWSRTHTSRTRKRKNVEIGSVGWSRTETPPREEDINVTLRDLDSENLATANRRGYYQEHESAHLTLTPAEARDLAIRLINAAAGMAAYEQGERGWSIDGQRRDKFRRAAIEGIVDRMIGGRLGTIAVIDPAREETR